MTKIVSTLPKNAAKRACYTCGAGGVARKAFWLTDVLIFAEGELVICDVCLTNAAAALGMIGADKATELTERCTHLEDANAQLTEIAGRHARLIGALEEVGVHTDHELGVPV